MRRFVRFGLVLVTAGFGATPAVAAGATHAEFNIAGAVLPCPERTYTVVSGTVREVIQEHTTPSGNTMFTVTDTLQHVVLVDQTGMRYSMRGATWFGGATNDNTGAEIITATHNFEIIAGGGGLADSIRLTERFRNGELISHEFGSCDLP